MLERVNKDKLTIYITAQVDLNNSGLPGQPEDDYAGQRPAQAYNTSGNPGSDVTLSLINFIP